MDGNGIPSGAAFPTHSRSFRERPRDHQDAHSVRYAGLTGPDQKRANHRIAKDATIRLEVWDSNPQQSPICIKKIRDLHEQAGPIPLDVDCDSGAYVSIRVFPPMLWGLGFSYELSAGGAAVSPWFESPLHGGCRPVKTSTRSRKKVEQMESGEPQSLINGERVGRPLSVRTARTARRREGKASSIPRSKTTSSAGHA
jgi:hypothetical protein